MGGDRVIGLTGQAYFDVAKDAAHPFRVSANGVNVNVLGTRFDVMAYADEPTINTTLVNGAARNLIHSKFAPD
jgi:ferric-dicitrate binding protein FerR (iron transport regulator)